MRDSKKACSTIIWIFAILIMLSSGTAITTYADVFLPNSFTPGTTISSSKVNENFTVLAQSMPGMKVAIGSGGVTLSTQWQNLASLTVTPPMDGIIILLGTALVTITQGSTAGGSSWGFSGMALCTTQTSGGGGGPSCTGGSGLVKFDTLSTGAVANNAPRLQVPTTIIGGSPVVKNTPVTYYLTASTESGSVGSIVINTSSLTAIFFPGGYLP